MNCFYAFSGRVRNPVFPHACTCIKIQLSDIVMTGIAGRDNLNAPVRRTGAALFREYVCQEKILDMRFAKMPQI